MGVRLESAQRVRWDMVRDCVLFATVCFDPALPRKPVAVAWNESHCNQLERICVVRELDLELTTSLVELRIRSLSPWYFPTCQFCHLTVVVLRSASFQLQTRNKRSLNYSHTEDNSPFQTIEWKAPNSSLSALHCVCAEISKLSQFSEKCLDFAQPVLPRAPALRWNNVSYPCMTPTLLRPPVNDDVSRPHLKPVCYEAQ